MGRSGYQQLWHVVNGAVTDAFNRHPNYLTKSGRKYATTSIVKRVTGTVLSFAVQQTARSRDAAVTASGEYSVSAPADDVAVIRTHSYAHVNERCYQAIRRALFNVGRSLREVRKDASRYSKAKQEKTAQLKAEMGRAG